MEKQQSRGRRDSQATRDIIRAPFYIVAKDLLSRCMHLRTGNMMFPNKNRELSRRYFKSRK